MATFSNYAFTAPGTELLSSLIGMREDLLGVQEYCRRLKAMRGAPFDLIAWEAYSAAAVIRYARCFSSGVRLRLPREFFDSAATAQKAFHRRMLDLRNMHVAHSVNELEENFVTITVRSEDGKPGEIQGVSQANGRTVGLELGEPEELHALVQWILARIELLALPEREAVLRLAKQAGVEAVVAAGTPLLGRAPYDIAVRRRRSRP